MCSCLIIQWIFKQGSKIIYHSNWDTFENGKDSIKNYVGATYVNQDCSYKAGHMVAE